MSSAISPIPNVLSQTIPNSNAAQPSGHHGKHHQPKSGAVGSTVTPPTPTTNRQGHTIGTKVNTVA